jgi:heme A synthase
MRGYPKWFYKYLMLVYLALFISGLLLIPTMLDLILSWDVPWRLSADQRILTAALHTIFGFLVMMCMGALWTIHMREGWRKNKNRKSGLALNLLLFLLLVSAIGIYYLSDEQALTMASVIHTVLGLSIFILFVQHAYFHAVSAKRTKPNSHLSNI